MPQIADLTDEERADIGAYKLHLVDYADALAAEMKQLRDILWGRKSVDDEPSALADFLGCAPIAPVRVRDDLYEVPPMDDSDEEETVVEAIEDDLPSGKYPVSSTSDDADGCIKRRLEFQGQQLVAEVEDDGWVLVVPSGDRLGLPVLSGKYANGKVRQVESQLPLPKVLQLVSAVEKLFAETFDRRRARASAMRQGRGRRATG